MGSVTVQAKVGGLIGDCAPLGYFDPLGFSKDASPETMKKYREAELKHGRVAMLAAAGMIHQDKWHPLFNGKLSRLRARKLPRLVAVGDGRDLGELSAQGAQQRPLGDVRVDWYADGFVHHRQGPARGLRDLDGRLLNRFVERAQRVVFVRDSCVVCGVVAWRGAAAERPV